MILSEINNAISLISRTSGWVSRYQRARKSVARRFVRLFAAHGVHRNQILRVLGVNAFLADVETDDMLMDILTDELLDKAARMFAIRREWLEGASDQIYPTHDFYKQSDRFLPFLNNLVGLSGPGTLRGMLIIAQTRENESNALLLLEQTIGSIGDKPLCRYHLCNNWYFNYWKSRAHLTACVAVGWRRNIYIQGREVPIASIRKYRAGLSFLDYRNYTALPTSGRLWHPEDMALKPSTFLAGLQSDERSQAVRVWLELHSSSLMETGLPYSGVRTTFESSLR